MRNVVFATATLLCWSSGAFADAYCEYYAQQAVEAAQESANNNCGFGGPRWSTDYNVHYQACIGGGLDGFQLNYELTTRNSDSLRCSICKSYENEAMKRVAIATALHCEFLDKSPIWPTSSQAQYNICWQNGLAGEISVEDQQKTDLAACKKQYDLRNALYREKATVVTRRNALRQQLSVRKVLPCPPQLGTDCNQPVTTPPKIANPGLLESDGGIARQGPSVVGAPIAAQGRTGGTMLLR